MNKPRINIKKGRALLAASVLTVLSISAIVSVGAATDQLAKGMQLAKQGKYQEASVALRQAPQSSTNYYYQGYCYYQLHQVNYAKKLFSFVVTSYPRSAEAKLASDFLRRIDPEYSASSSTAATSSSPTASTTSGSENNSQQLNTMLTKLREAAGGTADLSSLPDVARIYYTPASSGHMIVDAMVNGHPMKCMIDTGAPGLLFGKNNLRTMGIPVPSGPPTTTVSGWAGVALPAWNMPLTVKVGTVERTLNATIQEDFDMAPLIGYAFIKGYQYEIDARAKIMTLRKEGQTQGANQDINNLYDVPCKIIRTKPVVPLEVSGRKITVFVDTGASSTIINSEDAAAAHIEIPSDANVLYLSGVGGASPYRAVNLDLKLGPIIRKDFQVLIGGHAGNAVGQDFLSGWRFTVDENKGFLRFFH